MFKYFKNFLKVFIIMMFLVFSTQLSFSEMLDGQGPHGQQGMGYNRGNMMRQGRRGGMFNRMANFKISPEKEKEVLNFLKVNAPFTYSKLLELKDTKPIRYRIALRMKYMKYNMMQRVKKTDSKLYSLMLKDVKYNDKVKSLAYKYRNAKTDKEKKEIKKKLETLLNEYFDIRQQLKEQNLKRLEERLNRYKEMLSYRKKHKKEVINNYLDKLLMDRRMFRW